MIKIEKKDGTLEPWNADKIKIAVTKSAARANVSLSSEDLEDIAKAVEDQAKLIQFNSGSAERVVIPTRKLHTLVIDTLQRLFPKVAVSYQEYRDYKNTYAAEFEKIKNDADGVLQLGDRENANFDSSLVSTKGSLIKGYLTKSLYKQFYLSKVEKELTKRGDIYIHDLRDMILGSLNCFAKETKFITSTGVHSFSEFSDGDIVYVPTHKGNWKRAIVRCYGKQKLQKIEFKRASSSSYYVYATANHRWILKDGSETTNLKVGDKLTYTPNISKFDWQSLSLSDKKLWCLGFVIGDGYCPKGGGIGSVRLCGHKVEFANRFSDCGYEVTYPKWANGDASVKLPDVLSKHIPYSVLTYENTKVFINGLMSADGNLYKNGAKSSKYRGIFVVGKLNKVIYSLLSTAGYYPTKVTDATGQITNFGIRQKQSINYRTYEESGDRTWKVKSITDTNRFEKVWCLEVEDDHSFLLDHGIPTGNCCLFDMANVLKNGFEMSNVQYTEPKSVLAALQVIGDVTLAASAQQFGGFTIPELDKTLLPYCKMSLRAAAYEYEEFSSEPKDIKDYKQSQHTFAWYRLTRELEQGFQSLELKLNTIPSARGDFAFTTITFGQWDSNLPEDDKAILNLIGKTILHIREKGHGGKQVVFPKLVYLYDEEQVKEDAYSLDLMDEAVECSSKCMYPDWLSLSGNEKYNKVAQVFKESGKKAITSPMG